MKPTAAARLTFTSLEDRATPAVFTPVPDDATLISADDGGLPRVTIVDPTTGEDIGEIEAYEDSFRGGVRTALGDVTGDGVRDIVIAPGAGGGPRIRVIDGATGATAADRFVYEPTYTGGIYVAVGDVNGDGRGDLITGTGNGGGPRVRVLDGASLGAEVLDDFFAYEDSFRGGVLVSAGDVDGDGLDDVITGTGVGGGPRVLAFSGADGSVLRNFFAYEDSFRGGVLVSAGDVDGDGKADILCGTGPGGGPAVRTVSGADGKVLASFLADDSDFRGGVRVDSLDVTGDGVADFLTRTRRGNDDNLRVFDGRTGEFLRTISRTVDDDPSADDRFEGGRASLRPGGVTEIEGTVAAVDPEAGTVDIRLGFDAIVTVRVADGTEIERNDDHTLFASIAVGDRAEALVGPDGVAWKLEAEGAGANVPGGEEATRLSGTVTAIDATAGTFTVQRGTESVVVRTNARTKFEADDDRVTFAALTVGERVEVRLGATGVAVKVEIGDDDDDGFTDEVEGTVTAIDAAAGTLTLRRGDGTVEVRTDADTVIVREDATVTLAALMVGDRVEARIGADGIATRVEAEFDGDDGPGDDGGNDGGDDDGEDNDGEDDGNDDTDDDHGGDDGGEGDGGEDDGDGGDDDGPNGDGGDDGDEDDDGTGGDDDGTDEGDDGAGDGEDGGGDDDGTDDGGEDDDGEDDGTGDGDNDGNDDDGTGGDGDTGEDDDGGDDDGEDDGGTGDASDAAPNSRPEGTITAIDTDARTVTLRTEGGDLIRVRVNGDTDFERDDQNATLSSFRVGDTAEARIGADGIATEFEAESA